MKTHRGGNNNKLLDYRDQKGHQHIQQSEVVEEPTVEGRQRAGDSIKDSGVEGGPTVTVGLENPGDHPVC